MSGVMHVRAFLIVVDGEGARGRPLADFFGLALLSAKSLMNRP